MRTNIIAATIILSLTTFSVHAGGMEREEACSIYKQEHAELTSDLDSLSTVVRVGISRLDSIEDQADLNDLRLKNAKLNQLSNVAKELRRQLFACDEERREKVK